MINEDDRISLVCDLLYNGWPPTYPPPSLAITAMTEDGERDIGRYGTEGHCETAVKDTAK